MQVIPYKFLRECERYKSLQGRFFKFMIVLLMNVLTVPDILLNLTSKFIDTLRT